MNPETKVCFYTGLSNQGQSNWVNTFPQTPTDEKSMGRHFVGKADSNYKTKTLLKCFVSCQQALNQLGLCFVDKVNSNFKTKTLADMLSSLLVEAKSIGSPFCRYSKTSLNYEGKPSL